jgi:hypothetical protein
MTSLIQKQTLGPFKMAFNLILLSVVVGLSVLNVQVSAANCYNNQPIANTGPTAAEVVTALTENNQLSFVCSI